MNKILIIGACGQIGTELTAALRKRHGADQVIAADVVAVNRDLATHGPYVQLNALDKPGLHSLVLNENVKQVYHLAAMLSASGEKHPLKAWDLNCQSLLHVLDIAKTDKLRVFWPSSIAVFGANAPKGACPQHTVTEPSTVYGISKVAGELWCRYYHDHYGVDVRSIRYPGLISHTAQPGGGTTDYAVDIFHWALKHRNYTCYLKANTTLPMMYMPDAVRATIELMEANPEHISIRTSYNLSGFSVSPQELAVEIERQLPSFKIEYRPDFRQQIAESWPGSIDDGHARHDWDWRAEYDLEKMVGDMLAHLQQKAPV